MITVIAASSNPGKIREFRQILGENDRIIPMKEAGFSGEIQETGTTFLENAEIKARAVYRALQTDFDMILSDDSGLEIDFFGKKPGIYSSRWLGEATPYTVKNQKILADMQNVPDPKRTARYVCAIVCLLRDGRLYHVQETAEGRIAHAPSGTGGFGYDPIFEFPGKGTFAALTPEQKNELSHRGKALRAIQDLLRKEGVLSL